MDSLCGYLSDEEYEEEELTKEANLTEKLQPKDSAQSEEREITEVRRSSDIPYKKQLSETRANSFLDPDSYTLERLNIYLQNYLNQMSMSSCFLYLPWFPSMQTLKKLDSAATKAISQLNKANISNLKHFNWGGIKNGDMKHHISIYPNIVGKSHQIDQLTENLSQGISNMAINSRLTKVTQEEARRVQRLNQLLHRNNADGVLKPKKFINLGVTSHLLLFKSNTSNKLFLALTLDQKSTYSKRFFSDLTSLVQENVELLDLTRCSSLEPNFHISIKVAESPFVKLTNSEFLQLVDSLKHLTLDLRDVRVTVNELIVYHLNHKKMFTSIPFKI
ncbi:uncharacterized protein PRCAT00002063001 [Priceomyces carsonii]|uniref:uncharacterized protein n=1 Tax=Priceomyces carsonii TaxID=28549 RepID=UPI002ED7BEFB|nr:unnamed protein product [Priceomyces carsonii]